MRKNTAHNMNNFVEFSYVNVMRYNLMQPEQTFCINFFVFLQFVSHKKKVTNKTHSLFI